MDNRKFKKEPSAYLVPKLVDFSNAKKIHFSFVKDTSTMTDQEYNKMYEKAMKDYDRSVMWDVDFLVDDPKDLFVIDKNGRKYYPKPLYELEDK